jgi:hypothetical protein
MDRHPHGARCRRASPASCLGTQPLLPRLAPLAADVSGSNGTSNGDTTSVSTPKAGGDVEPAPSSARLPQAAADAASDAVDAATGLAASMVQGAQDAAAEAVYTADQLAYNAQQGVVAGISGLAAAADEAAGAVLPRPSSSSPTTFNMGGCGAWRATSGRCQAFAQHQLPSACPVRRRAPHAPRRIGQPCPVVPHRTPPHTPPATACRWLPPHHPRRGHLRLRCRGG